MRRIRTIVLVVSSLLATHLIAQDWTQWRGPNRDGAATGFTAPQVWPQTLTQRWKVEVGQGYATPLIAGDRIYMFSRQGENEVMSALDAASGKQIWQTGYPVTFTMQSAAARHGAGPKSTPVLVNGKLYSIGMIGTVTAWDAASGKQIWQKPGTGVVPMYTTHAFSPLVDRGLVIFHTGGHMKGALTAFDTNTGDVKWSWDGDGPGYGSPVVAEFGGTRQIVTITQGKLVGVDAATGASLWERPFVSSNFTNGITPVVFGQTLIVSGNGGPTVALGVAKKNDQWAIETLWENADIPLRFSNGVIVRDKFFSLANRNSGQYFAVDAATGKTAWVSEPRQAGNAAVVKAGNFVFVLEDDGELLVLPDTLTAFEPLRRYKLSEAETWTQPVISGNRVFLKDVTSLTLWTLS